MATRFSFTKQQFAEIKRLQAKGETHRQVSEKFDLGETTLRKIKRALTYHDYVSSQRLSTFKRRQREKRAAENRRSVYLRTILILAMLAVMALAMYWTK